jgi:hypothetical protein
VCAGCQRSGDKCVWPARKSQQSRRLREANDRIRELEANLRIQSAGNVDSREAANADADGSPQESSHLLAAQSLQAGSPNTTAAVPQSTDGAFRKGLTAAVDRCHPAELSNPETVRSCGGSSQASAGTARNLDPALATNLWYQVGIGDDGAVVYNGPTSRFHAGSLPEEGSDGEDNDGPRKRTTTFDSNSDSDDDGARAAGRGKRRRTSTSGSDARHSAALQSQYTLLDAVWMPLIEGKPTMNGTGVDTKTGMALLDIYWSWLHPLHSIVYRPALLMDLALGGPNCSDFLLLCIFALAARHLPSGQHRVGSQDDNNTAGERYLSKAKELLLDEMTAPTPTLPTIQGLLILGGRQCAMGMSSQGWLYTGMAIRMMQDIGLHLNNTQLLGYMKRWTPVELETRKRLYNSAYIWDKTLSLALGRPPSLIRPPYPESDILDKFDDQRVWRPIHAKEVAESFAPSPSWAASTFCAFCSLHEITTDMMLLLSRSQGAGGGSVSEDIKDLDRRFCRWYENVPSHLKIENPLSLKHSPPPHIVSLK